MSRMIKKWPTVRFKILMFFLSVHNHVNTKKGYVTFGLHPLSRPLPFSHATLSLLSRSRTDAPVSLRSPYLHSLSRTRAQHTLATRPPSTSLSATPCARSFPRAEAPLDTIVSQSKCLSSPPFPRASCTRALLSPNALSFNLSRTAHRTSPSLTVQPHFLFTKLPSLVLSLSLHSYDSYFFFFFFFYFFENEFRYHCLGCRDRSWFRERGSLGHPA